jgi:deoxyribodipyrimidine photo-lyase
LRRRVSGATLPPMSTLVWFRQDLRLADNPALCAAQNGNAPVIPVYIFAPREEGAWPPGAASRWWLHHSLARLGNALAQCGSRLLLRVSDDSLATLHGLAREVGATRVVWNRRYEPAIIARDQRIKTALRDAGLATSSYNARLLREPWTVKTKSGGPFQVFTPFWRHCLALEDPGEPLPAPETLTAPPRWPDSPPLESLGLLPAVDWAAGMRATWTPGSAGAHAALQSFLNDSFDDYRTLRDRPAVRGTSQLSPHLHFGEIGPREVWHAARRVALARDPHGTAWRNSQFLTELGWREFAYHLLFHFPATPEQPLRANYAAFPWAQNAAARSAWTRGATGYPIVDAGLRQLWHTGWMHNRVRMIAASFLIKDLLIDWTDGARWFWDTLVDADLASNTLGWQWVAGCGADAAPFFRIFNPSTQGAKFDPQGDYVRRWLPELARLSNQWIQEPSAAPAEVLEAAGIRLGTDYPYPLVDHAVARKAALAALSRIKKTI